jgi:GNAT superfamily N-acetyltransferase
MHSTERLNPETATDDDLADYHTLSVAAFAVDRPDAPAPTYEAMAARLRTPITRMDAQKVWVVRRAGRIVAVATAQAPEPGGNEHLSVTDIRVHPRHRRGGIGTALLRSVLGDLRAAGRRRILGEGVTAGGDGAAWAAAVGFAEVNRFVLQVLPVAGTDPARWDVPVPAGYRLERWSAAAPDRLVASYAAARGAMADAPPGESTFQFPQWTVQSVRAAESVYRERKVGRWVVAAVGPTGGVVGVTEVEIYPGQPELVVQQDTVVVPAHRGHGLGRSLKATMMRWLLVERPGIDRVVTNTAAENSHMIHVNDQLGYATTRTMVDVEADVAALADRFGC